MKYTNIRIKGDNNVYNDSKNKSINEENSNIGKSEESDFKNDTNEERTKDGIPVFKRKSGMDRRSYNATENIQNKGIYKANE